ncbi:MAG: hypothetical protein ACRDGN_17365 [bacterium]
MRSSTAFLLAWRTFQTRPRRTAILLLGFGIGVGVMIALLAVGDALLAQARDRDVVSGGDLVLLPAGIDPEVLKVGAVTGMFLAIPNARSLVRQVLMGPRFAHTVDAASPEITGKLVYLRTRERIVPARASAAIPSAARRSGSALAIADPAWKDTAEDQAWLAPSASAVLEEIDRFHQPVLGPDGRTWAEWWYFNFADPRGASGYISFVADRERRVLVSVAVQRPDGPAIRWQETHAGATLPLSGATYRAGPHVIELRSGIYHVHLARPGFSADLRFRPVPHLYFPPVEWRAGLFRSGYVVPALSASVTGEIRAGAGTIRVDGTGYHDHNWGVWRAVTWEWGTASVPEFALLAGLVRHPSLAAQEMLVTVHGRAGGRTGLLAILRGAPPARSAWRPGPKIRGVRIAVPGRLRYVAANEAGDRLSVEIIADEITATPVEKDVFLQMRGGYKVEGYVGGRRVAFTTQGFAETFIPLPSRP